MRLRWPLLLALSFFALCLAGFGLAGWFDRRTVIALTAKQSGCPDHELTLLEHSGGFMEDYYLLEGCGQRFELFCAAQDPEGCTLWACKPTGDCPHFRTSP